MRARLIAAVQVLFKEEGRNPLLSVAALCLMITAALFLFSTQPVQAQQEPAPSARLVDVGVHLSPPFVEKEGSNFTGMAIDLWEAVATSLGLSSNYVEYRTIGELVSAVANNEIDAAVSNITITRQRAERVGFTQPWYDAGLRIMVREEGSGGFRNVLEGLSDAGHLRAYAWLLTVIILATIGFTLFDRKFDPDFPKRWREGTAESFYHVMSIATVGRAPRKNLFGWVGRIWQALWLIIGVGVIAYITSSVTSVMTAVSIERGIHSLSDLPGRTVGVFSGSVAEEFVTELGIASRPYTHINEAAEALRAGEVEAIVGDAPILEYFAHNNPELEFDVVGSLFHPDKYGFAFHHESDLTRPATLRILELIEDETVEDLRTRYFGIPD
jgi:polar amino acid transport system substrate-binding protein